MNQLLNDVRYRALSRILNKLVLSLRKLAAAIYRDFLKSKNENYMYSYIGKI